MLLASGYIDITPKNPVQLSGYEDRKGMFEEIHDHLEINLVAIRESDKTILIYSIDTFIVPIELEQLILEKFGTTYNIKSEDVWLVASHTHYSPSLDKNKPLLGEADDEYIRYVKAQTFRLTEDVLASGFKESELLYGTSVSVLNVNRRKKLLRPKGFMLKPKVLLYPDYNGVKDDAIRAIECKDDSGTVDTIIWNYACHPVGFTEKRKVSADYIGVVRDYLRKRYNNDSLTVIFLQGFAGNLKPDVTPVTRTRWRDKLGYILQLAAWFVRFQNIEQYKNWTLKLSKETEQALTNKRPVVSNKLSSAATTIPLNEIIGAVAERSINIKKLQLSDELTFIGLSEEIFAEYRNLIEKEIATTNLISVGYLAGTNIYLPTDKNVKEGGYEIERFGRLFGIEGTFKTGIENKIIKAIRSL